MHMTGSAKLPGQSNCCLVAIYYFETVLKSFGKLRQKGDLASQLSSSILQEYCNFSVLKQVLSICTNFHNELLYRKFAAVLKACQR